MNDLNMLLSCSGTTMSAGDGPDTIFRAVLHLIWWRCRLGGVDFFVFLNDSEADLKRASFIGVFKGVLLRALPPLFDDLLASAVARRAECTRDCEQDEEEEDGVRHHGRGQIVPVGVFAVAYFVEEVACIVRIPHDCVACHVELVDNVDPRVEYLGGVEHLLSSSVGEGMNGCPTLSQVSRKMT